MTKEDSNTITQIVRRTGAATFARNLVDELRDIAGCKETADTCRNECCHVATAIECGLGQAAEPLASLCVK